MAERFERPRVAAPAPAPVPAPAGPASCFGSGSGFWLTKRIVFAAALRERRWRATAAAAMPATSNVTITPPAMPPITAPFALPLLGGGASISMRLLEISATVDTKRMAIVAPDAFAAAASSRRELEAAAAEGAGTPASSAPSDAYNEESAGTAEALPARSAPTKAASVAAAVLTAAAGSSNTESALACAPGDAGDASIDASAAAAGALAVTRAEISVHMEEAGDCCRRRRRLRAETRAARACQALQSAAAATTAPPGSATGSLAAAPGAATNVTARKVIDEFTAGCTAAAAHAENLRNAMPSGAASSARPSTTASWPRPHTTAVSMKEAAPGGGTYVGNGTSDVSGVSEDVAVAGAVAGLVADTLAGAVELPDALVVPELVAVAAAAAAVPDGELLGVADCGNEEGVAAADTVSVCETDAVELLDALVVPVRVAVAAAAVLDGVLLGVTVCEKVVADTVAVGETDAVELLDALVVPVREAVAAAAVLDGVLLGVTVCGDEVAEASDGEAVGLAAPAPAMIAEPKPSVLAPAALAALAALTAVSAAHAGSDDAAALAVADAFTMSIVLVKLAGHGAKTLQLCAPAGSMPAVAASTETGAPAAPYCTLAGHVGETSSPPAGATMKA